MKTKDNKNCFQFILKCWTKEDFVVLTSDFWNSTFSNKDLLLMYLKNSLRLWANFSNTAIVNIMINHVWEICSDLCNKNYVFISLQ